MGFYGNITYNTYGLQEKGVKPEHLDRSYWRTAPAYEVIGQTGLRTLLSLKEVEANQKDIWDTQWAEAEKTCFKFYFPNNAENMTLRKLYGNGYLLGWVRKNTLKMTDWTNSNNWTLYMMALNGERTGQIFYYPISPIKAEIELSTTDESNITDKGKLENWLNDYLAGPVVTGKQIKNNSITTILINDGAVTEEKIGDKEVSTIKIAGEAVTEEKIAGYAISGGKIKEHAISAYNIADGTITTQQIAAYTITGGEEGNIAEKTITDFNIASHTVIGENIAEKTITNFNIADNTITKDQLKDTYARCHYGQGYPTTTITIGLIDRNELNIGDLYIDLNTGFIYIYKGYNIYQGKYDWISYLSGGRGNNRPKTGNIGDIWVDSSTGKVYIYQELKTSAGVFGWSPIQTYQDIQTGEEINIDENEFQLKFISGEQSVENETGLYTNLKTLLTSVSGNQTTLYMFYGDLPSKDSDITKNVFNKSDTNLFIGVISYTEIGAKYPYSLTCFDTNTGGLFRITAVYEAYGSNNERDTFVRVKPLIGPSVITNSINQYNNTTVSEGTLAFDSEHTSLQIYINGEWKQIQAYSTSATSTEQIEVNE